MCMMHGTIWTYKAIIIMIMMHVALLCVILNSHDVCRNITWLHELLLCHKHKNKCEMHSTINVYHARIRMRNEMI